MAIADHRPDPSHDGSGPEADPERPWVHPDPPFRPALLKAAQPRLVGGRTGDGTRPIILLHGLTVQHRSFNVIARALVGSGLSLVAPDLRGRGDSDKPPFGYGFTGHAGDVLAMMDEQDIERAILVGHSMGAFVALCAAVRSPRRVAGLVLIDGGFPRMLTPFQDPQLVTAMLHSMMSIVGRVGVASTAAQYITGAWGDANLADVDVRDAVEYDHVEHRGSWYPKAAAHAVRQDSWLAGTTAPWSWELRRIRCPVHLFRAASGMTADDPALLNGLTMARLRCPLPQLEDTLVDDSTHASIVLERTHASVIARGITAMARRVYGPPDADIRGAPELR